MPIPKRRAQRGLERKGFRCDDTHHRYFTYVALDGTITDVRTRISHSSSGGDIDDSLIARMAIQCHLDKRGFNDLVNCPMSQEDYERRLREQGLI